MKALVDDDKMQKESILISFMRLIVVLIKKRIMDSFFQTTLFLKFLHVLKLSRENEGLADLGIYSLMILIGAVGIDINQEYMDRILSLIVPAYLKYKTHKNIKQNVLQIFSFFLHEKKSHSKAKFNQI
jgi:hypothetical protein